eukprot:5060982-Ditylum_brightwellii.AAC.1
MYDDSTTHSSADQCSDSAASTCTETSAGNTSLSTLEVCQLEAEGSSYNYRGSTVIIKNETPATVCTANTIGHLQSRQLLKVLLDSRSKACLIKRSALPKGINLKDLASMKSFNTLAGTLDMQQMVTLQDVHLPEFDKNRHISQQYTL